MQVKLGHNGLDRVPSRAKLVPKVTPWHRMSQPQTHTQTQPDGHLTQKPNVVEPLIVADEPSIVTVAGCSRSHGSAAQAAAITVRSSPAASSASWPARTP